MLVSAISKLDSSKALKNTSYSLKNNFNGDKNTNTIEKCKPHYKNSSSIATRHFAESDSKNTSVEENGNSLSVLA